MSHILKSIIYQIKRDVSKIVLYHFLLMDVARINYVSKPYLECLMVMYSGFFMFIAFPVIFLNVEPVTLSDVRSDVMLNPSPVLTLLIVTSFNVKCLDVVRRASK